MKLKDFEIGKEFLCSGQKWLCTDIGTRIITAIETDKPDWMGGPPYAIPEQVFDENDQVGCSLITE